MAGEEVAMDDRRRSGDGDGRSVLEEKKWRWMIGKP